MVKERITPELQHEFIWFAHFIDDHGYEGKFYDGTYVYFDIDDKKYWIMDEDANKTNLINRARL